MAEATRGTALTRTGKTRRKVECTPPNKKCGGRCIPPDWDCRLEGKGTNPALKVVKNDPLAGAASIERGVKDITKGVTTLDPAKVQRGRSSVIRGIVKIAPGNSLEDKNKLRKRLEEGSSAAFALTLAGILGVVSHKTLYRYDFYRDGVGGRINRAAFTAVNGVLDITPGQRGQRNAIRGAATVAQIDLMRAARRGNALTIAGNNAKTNLRRVGPLGFLGDRIGANNSPLLEGSRLRNTMRELARNTDAEQFSQQATSRLFSTRIGRGHNLFSESAAQTFINSEFNLGLGSVINPPLQRRTPSGLVNNAAADLTLTSRKDAVVTRLATRLQGWGTALQADMRLRGYADEGGVLSRPQIDRYIREQALPIIQPYTRSMGPNATAAVSNYERQMRLLIEAGDRSTAFRRLATGRYNATVRGFDSYFDDVVDRFTDGPIAASSPFGDGKVALAKYLRGSETYSIPRGTGPTRVVSREHANMLVADWHHRHSTKVKVNERAAQLMQENSGLDRKAALARARQENRAQKSPYVVQPAAAQRVAQIMQRSPELPSPDDAVTTLRRSGLRIQLPPSTNNAARRYGGRSEAQLLASMMRETRVNRKGERVPRYASRAAALRALRARQQENNDADDLSERNDFQKTQGTGKPCGESHIAKSKECTKTVKAPVHTNPETGKRTLGYRARQATSLALRTGTTLGAGAIAYKNLKDLYNMKGKPNMSVLYTSVAVTLLGANSLKREATVTKSTKQIVNEFSQLKQQPGVEAKTIDQLTKFAQEAGIDVQRVDTLPSLMGFGGYFDSASPSRIRSNGLSTPINKRALVYGTPEESYSNGVAKMIELRQQMGFGGVRRHKQFMASTTMQDKLIFHGNGGFIGRKEGRDLYTMAHEMAHAIHYRSDFATPRKVVVNGKTYSGKELERELEKSTSIYGMSDMLRTAKGPTKNYYQTGSRLETYAENYAMYVGNGKAMKKAFPVSYEWTRLTTDNALRYPTKKPARKFTDVVEDLSKLPERNYIDRLDADGSSFEAIYTKVREASVRGDVRTVIQEIIKANEQKLDPEKISMLSSFFETAVLYAREEANKSRGDASPEDGQREDAPAKGKPCGKTHIPKEKKCHTPVTKEQIANAAKYVVAGIYVGGAFLAYRSEFKTAQLKSKINKAINDKNSPNPLAPSHLSRQIAGLKGKSGVDDKVIDQVNKFVTKAKINVNTKADASHFPSTFGYWNVARPNVLNVPYFNSERGSNPTPDMGRVARLGASTINRPQPLGLFRRWGVSNGAPVGSSDQFMLTTIHELGHALHGRVGFSTPKRLRLNGRTYEGAELTRMLNRSITEYGASDLRQGRYEMFAEYFTMYVTNGNTLKQRNPVAWAWTKSIVDKATAVDPNFTPGMREQVMNVVKATKEGRRMFDSADSSPEKLLNDARELALAGKPDDFKALVDNYEGKLTLEQFQVIGSLYETAGIYAYTNANKMPDAFPNGADVTLD